MASLQKVGVEHEGTWSVLKKIHLFNEASADRTLVATSADIGDAVFTVTVMTTGS